MPEELLRTFIAIDLDESLRRAIGRVQANFKRAAPWGSVKWVASDGIHLTLKFLGDTPAGRLPEIEAALRTACAAHAGFEIVVEGRGCFPNFRRPSVVWVAVRDTRRVLANLQSDIEKHVAPLGWPTEARVFSPHLTLGRVARGTDREAEDALGQVIERSVVEQIGVQRVGAVSLMRSELRPSGAVYTRLLSVPLG